MEEVILLFLYHKLDAVTLRHYEMLQLFHPREQIVPVGYQLKMQEWLPDTVDVALDWDYGWPIFSTWHEVDKIYLRWFLRPNRPRARRYVFFEYDIRPNVVASSFYGDAWNAHAAAACIKTPESDRAWTWWEHSRRLGAAIAQRQGVSPMSGTLWSDDALQQIARAPQFQDCYCELRMGTLAKMLGFQAQAVPGAERTISWRPEDIRVTDETTWFHPVKT